MSKERLEEIEAKHSTLTITSERGGIEYTEVDVKDLVFLIQNGFEQVKRVQELEEVAETDGSAFHSLEKLCMESEQQNRRYRELIKKMTRIVYDPDVDCGMICTEIIEMEESE